MNKKALYCKLELDCYSLMQLNTTAQFYDAYNVKMTQLQYTVL